MCGIDRHRARGVGVGVGEGGENRHATSTAFNQGGEEPVKMNFDGPTPSVQMTVLSGLSFRVILQIFAHRSRGEHALYASINISMLPSRVRHRPPFRRPHTTVRAKNRPGQLHFPNGTIFTVSRSSKREEERRRSG